MNLPIVSDKSGEIRLVKDGVSATLSNVGDAVKPSEATNLSQVQSLIAASSGSMLIGSLIGANMNTVLDQEILLANGTKFIITDIVIGNASVELDTAANGIFNTDVSRGGNNLFYGTDYHWSVIIFDLLSFLVAPQQYMSIRDQQTITAAKNTLLASPIISYTSINNKIYFSLGTPQGAAATADIYVFGVAIS